MKNNECRVIQLWINEPQYVIPPVKRAQILSDDETPANHISGNEAYITRIHGPDDKPSTREIIRELIPTESRITKVSERIRLITQTSNTFRAEFEPITTPIPYFYPKVAKFAYVYRDGCVSIQIIPLTEPNLQESVESLSKQAKVWTKLTRSLIKFGLGFANNYQKRVVHDVIIPKIQFQNLYLELKLKYHGWVSRWPKDQLDPSKHVFEDIAIATFLISLWNQDAPQSDCNYDGKKVFQRFVDIGCGNGFLVHILTCEGYSGYGIDISKRKIWDMYEGGMTRLDERTINPTSQVFENIDWIIGNHPDELTLWIPIMASKSNAKFVIIPCCFHELSGAKYARCDTTIGKYKTYIDHVESVISVCGFRVETEYLRIPSTKNLAIVGRERIFAEDNVEEISVMNQGIAELVANVSFIARISDAEKESSRKSLLRQKLALSP